MSVERFPEISGKIKAQIEEVLESSKCQWVTYEAVDIYEKVVRVFERAGPNYIRRQKIFPFREYILAWQRVLKEAGIQGELSDVLLGVILATVYEKTKTKGG